MLARLPSLAHPAPVSPPRRPPLPVMPRIAKRAPARLIRYALRLQAQPLGLPVVAS